MKLMLKIVIPLAVLLTAATIAAAAPLTPTTPYPAVPANANVCKVEKLEVEKWQVDYDFAKRAYDRGVRLGRAISSEELRARERAVHQAAIKLNAAKYAEAACRNDKGADRNKACIALALELNKLVDELGLVQSLESLAAADYDMARRLWASRSIALEELEKFERAYRIAVIERRQAQQRIADQRDKIRNTPACRDYPVDRPSPTSTSTTPTSTTTQVVPTTR